MMIGYGDNNLIMVLKTSVTPNNMSMESVDRRVKDIEDEFLEKSKEHPLMKVINFNKTVCTELGLTMYTADKKSRDLMTRVEVTK